ncbi:hypothetical protein M2D63_001380 [Pseudomonas sp. BJa5]|uniref:hypothetical protein n=1 Tax=Pseudomonas sp. BJa5 TaxID=2936270 RepID=UPI0025595250|nr:hypothetical protein [Pseudomonas sp. BGr12]MDL2419768.1 hypothetical protein [Pseudomonas sp. BGr12]
MERELARALTWACELGKSEILGFEWLTHRVDYERFPESLIVTWVFDSDRHMNAAIASQAKVRMHELTQAAFEDIGITVAQIAAHVEVDSEERCASRHGGDWDARLSSRQRSGGKHGQGH